MLRSHARSPSPAGRRSSSPGRRPAGRAKAARSRSPSSARSRVDSDVAEKPAEAIVHAVEDLFKRFDVDEDGFLSRDDLASILRELDSDTWCAARLEKLLPIKGLARKDKIDFREFLTWVFHDGADQAALQSTSVSAVFAYGTLRGDFGPEGDRWGVIKEFNAQWQPASLRGFQLFQEAGSFYPLAVHTGNHDDTLVGTLLQFPDRRTALKAIKRCNHIEGYDPDSPDDGLYRRTMVKVDVHGERAALAFIYYKRFPDCADHLWLGFRGLSTAHVEHIAFPRRPLGLTYPQGIITKVKEESIAAEAGVQVGWHIVSVNFSDVSILSPSETQSMVTEAIAELPEASETDLDGSWTVRWESGATDFIELKDGKFELDDETHTLEMGREPVQFKWPNGTVQSIAQFGPQVIEWKTTDPAYKKIVWRRREERKQITHFSNGDWLRERKFATLGFGSNSVRQLRGRLEDRRLRGFPAKVFNHVLAFAGPNWTWSVDADGEEGGTATLVPMEGEVALGTVAFLTEGQLEVLDSFEGVPFVYERQTLPAEVLQNGCWHRMLVVAYLKVSVEWYPPSEAYKCAVMRNISGSFPTFRKLVLRDTKGEVRGEWQHPGYSALGLGAFLFEVGVRTADPWQLPRQISSACGDLADAGIDGTVGAVSDALLAGSLPFTDEEKGIIGRLLSKSTRMDEAYTSDVEDESQAERASSEWASRESHAVAKAKPKAKAKVAIGQSKAKASPRARSPVR